MHMNKHIASAALMIFGGTICNPACAELLTNPVAKSPVGKVEVTALFSTSSVTYDLEGVNGDVDRTFLGASGAYGLSDKLDIYGAFALITEAELENSSGDSGTALAFGIRGTLPVKAQVKVQGYAQLLIIDEDYNNTVSGKDTALSIGAVVVKKVDNVTLYGGPELVLYSDGKVSGGGGHADTERDDILGLRGGAVFDVGGLDVGLGLAIMHESGFTLSASKAF